MSKSILGLVEGCQGSACFKECEMILSFSQTLSLGIPLRRLPQKAMLAQLPKTSGPTLGLG
jgi:hypothetical protein